MKERDKLRIALEALELIAVEHVRLVKLISLEQSDLRNLVENSTIIARRALDEIRGVG